MFTGIVTALGQVRAIEKRGDTHMVIAAPFDAAVLDVGASIACSGCCLTVVERDHDSFAVTVSGETLACTTLGSWKPGDPVNLERPLKVGDELGGHIVTGHIDGTVEVKAARQEGESLRLTLAAPPELANYIAAKGSVALDGVSLTVNEVNGASFGVNIIPHTAHVTSLGRAKPGARLNLEIDVMARYVARLVQR
jgi:riboflavin synthase